MHVGPCPWRRGRYLGHCGRLADGVEDGAGTGIGWERRVQSLDGRSLVNYLGGILPLHRPKHPNQHVSEDKK